MKHDLVQLFFSTFVVQLSHKYFLLLANHINEERRINTAVEVGHIHFIQHPPSSNILIISR